MTGMNEVLVMEDLRARLQVDPGQSTGDKKHQRAGRQEAEMMDLREEDRPGHVPGVVSARLRPMDYETYRNAPKRNQEKERP